MNCNNCGAPLTAEDKFCKNCGAEVLGGGDEKVNNNLGNVGNGLGQEKKVEDVTLTENTVLGGGMPKEQAVMNETMISEVSTNGPVAADQSTRKKNNGMLYGLIATGCVAAVAIVVAILALTGVFGGGNQGGGQVASTDVVEVPSTATYKAYLDGFSFDVPENIIYQNDVDETGRNVLYLMNESDTWEASLAVMSNVSFDQLKANKSQLQVALSEFGDVSPLTEQTIAGVEYVLGSISVGSDSLMMAFAKANAMNVFGVELANIDYTVDFSLLENISPIIASAQYDPSVDTHNIQTSGPFMNGMGMIRSAVDGSVEGDNADGGNTETQDATGE